MLPIIIRDAEIAEELFPEVSGSSQGFWDGMKAAELRVQRCAACRRYRFPGTPVCPYCGHRTAEWQAVDGEATVFSWIRYHKVYLPTYTRIPYTVVTSQLDAGFRMYGRLLDSSGDQSSRRPLIGERVHAVVEEWANGHRTIAFQESESALQEGNGHGEEDR